MDMYTAREYTEVVEVPAVACAAGDRDDDNNKCYSFIPFAQNCFYHISL